MELADCYLALNMYRQALFCLDEVMLLIPQNHIPQLKAAETLYSIGHLASALKRFCRALELCPDNVRALYGIQLCLARLLNRSGDPSGSGDDAVAPPSQETLEKLSTLVSSQLNDIYTRSKGNKASASISVQGKRSYTAPSHLAAIVAQMCN
ncbi:hypothetical protein GQ42DRAFT_35008 [Ramicandelaber brevisporus]|nr:hypothetical protein GQ42DRAFT_35008 [Ramicandelaber brevisporus]